MKRIFESGRIKSKYWKKYLAIPLVLFILSLPFIFTSINNNTNNSIIEAIEEVTGVPLNNDSEEENKSEKTNTSQLSPSLITKEFDLERSGYCYNPEYPENGPSKEILDFNWEELTGDEIVKQIYINYSFLAEDDHYGSFSDEDTGDIFTLIDVLYNGSTGEEQFRGGVATFPGACSADRQLHLQNITKGIGLSPIYQLEIEISNCGEYPIYWKLGLFSEPDPGNEWRLELKFIYQTYV